MFENLYTEEFANELKQLLESNNNDNLEVSKQFFNLYINNRSSETETEIMLRFNKHTKKVIIARISFHNKGKGYLKKTLALLSDFVANSESYEYIEFEAVLSDTLRDYLPKIGYEELEYVPFNYTKKIK